MTEPKTIDELVGQLRAERSDWNPDTVMLAGAAAIVERIRQQLSNALTEAGQQGIELQQARAEVEHLCEQLVRRTAVASVVRDLAGVQRDDVLALTAEVTGLRADMDAIRAALGNGADDDLWRPGMTVAETVEWMVAELGRMRAMVVELEATISPLCETVDFDDVRKAVLGHEAGDTSFGRVVEIMRAAVNTLSGQARAEVERLRADYANATAAIDRWSTLADQRAAEVDLLREQLSRRAAVASVVRDLAGVQRDDVLSLTARVEAHNNARQSAEQRELAALADLDEARAEIERLRASLADWEDSARRAYEDPCAGDERHCTCVPLLRRRVAELEAEVSRLDVTMAEGRDRRTESSE